MTDRRRLLRIFFVLLAFGLVSFFAILVRPETSAIRAVDMVHLIGTGMCLGGALVALALAVNAARP